ncbi:MAG: DUF3048 domain-containing protein [Chloroflexota bacterium]
MRRLLTLIVLLTLLTTACTIFGSQGSTSGNLAGLPTQTENPPPTPVPTHTASPTATQTPTATPTETPTPVVYGPGNFPENINPLTGLQVEDVTLLERRPTAVKIQLYPRSTRPPWGLSFADIVYEYYHEGGLTRFTAIFYGNDVDLIGPIRSARFFDAHIMRMYKAVFAFGSGDYRVRNRLYNSEIAELLVSEFPAGCPPMCRIEPDTWDHLVTNTRDLSQYISDKGVENGRQNLDGMKFDVLVPVGGEAGGQIVIRFSYGSINRWTYNLTLGTYQREQETDNDDGHGEDFAAFGDKLTEEQITADNLVVLFVPHEFYSRNPEMLEMLFTGSGTAYAFRDGRAYKVCWLRPTDKSVVTLAYAGPNGCQDASELFPFKPGNTWYEIVGMKSEVTQENGNWRFVFTTP